MLVTGGNGLLGSDVCRSFSGRYGILRTDREELDVTRPDDCMRIIGKELPDVVVHCAAYTAVDRAEREEEEAFRINAGGTRNVAAACREHGALLVTYGTDYVFDGSAKRPYTEDDPVGPLSAYGRSKLAAEEALRETAPDFLLIRTQWLYGEKGRSFASTVLDRAGRGEELRIVSDQRGCPTWSLDLAEATGRLMDAGARGTFHFSGEGDTTFYEYAAFLLRHAGMNEAQLKAIATADLPRDRYPAPRPSYSVLGKGKYREATGRAPRRWEDALLDFLRSRGIGESRSGRPGESGKR